MMVESGERGDGKRSEGGCGLTGTPSDFVGFRVADGDTRLGRGEDAAATSPETSTLRSVRRIAMKGWAVQGERERREEETYKSSIELILRRRESLVWLTGVPMVA